MTTVLDEIQSTLGWNEVPLRAVGVKVSNVGYPNLEPLSVFLDAGVVPRSSREDNHNQLGESLEKYQRVLPNDLVFNKLRTWQGGFGISEYEGIVSPAYIIVRLNTEVIHPKFLGYLLKSKPYLAELTRLSKWMPPTQFDISWENLRDLRLRFPPIEEQRRIADYLDLLIGKIDSSMQKLMVLQKSKDDLIKSKLHEYINERLELRPLKRVAHISVSNVDKHSHQDELEISLCNYVDVYKNRYINDGIVFMNSTATREQMKSFKVRKGDILFTKDSETAEDIASCAYVPVEIANLVLGYHCGILRPYSINGEYLYWALQTPFVKQQFQVAATGVTRVGIKLSDIGSILIPIASDALQPDIADKIGKYVRSLDDTNDRFSKLISALYELKVSTISSLVVGQQKAAHARR